MSSYFTAEKNCS